MISKIWFIIDHGFYGKKVVSFWSNHFFLKKINNHEYGKFKRDTNSCKSLLNQKNFYHDYENSKLQIF